MTADWNEDWLREYFPRKDQEEHYCPDFPYPGSFGVRFSKGGKKSFFLVYSLTGRRYRLTLGSYPLISLEEAKRRARDRLREVDQGKNPSLTEKLRKTSPSLKRLSDLFLQQASENRRGDSTQREYTRILSREILPRYGGKSAIDIVPADLEFLHAQISLSRGSPVMADRTTHLFKSILKFGVKTGRIPHNPISNWKPPASETVPPQASRERRLPFPDLLRLWVLFGEEDPLLSGPFQILLLTGQRPLSVLQMKWSQIRGELWNIPSPKGLPSIPFFLTPTALQCLKTIQDQQRLRRFPESPYVFPSRDGGHRKHLRKTSLRLSQKLGLKKGFSPITLRLTVRENLFDLGIRPDVIERILYPQQARRPRRSLLEGTPYNYADEVKEALSLWSRRLTTVTPLKPFPGGRSASKVVSLFPSKDR